MNAEGREFIEWNVKRKREFLARVYDLKIISPCQIQMIRITFNEHCSTNHSHVVFLPPESSVVAPSKHVNTFNTWLAVFITKSEVESCLR